MEQVPIGLSISPDFITQEYENNLVRWLDEQPWSNELSRRTQQYGYGYDYKRKGITTERPLEGPIFELANMISNYGIETPVQCIVNEYTRNQGIAPHIDNLSFGKDILGISILGDAVMTFERNDPTPTTFDCFLPRRSAIYMTADARYFWKHGISKNVKYIDGQGNMVTKPQDYRRISLTFRCLARK